MRPTRASARSESEIEHLNSVNEGRVGRIGLAGIGFQHAIAMSPGVVAVPVLIADAAALGVGDTARLVSGALLVSGLATIVQSMGILGIGSRLPMVQGVSMVAVPTALVVLDNAGTGAYGVGTVLGSAAIACLLGFLLAGPFSRATALLPPVVTGSIVVVIGLSLTPLAGRWILQSTPQYSSGGGLALASITLLGIVLASKSRRLSPFAIVPGLLAGCLGALLLEPESLALSSADSAFFRAPQPLLFSLHVDAVAVASFTICVFVIMAETTGAMGALANMTGDPLGSKRAAAGLRADMACSMAGAVFGALPTTAFAQNVGLVSLTRVTDRRAVAAGGAFLALAALFPHLGYLVSAIPKAVLGGIALLLFGSVIVSGVRLMARDDLGSARVQLTAAVAVGVGVLPAAVPDYLWSSAPEFLQPVLHSGVTLAAVAAILLNLALRDRSPQPSGEPPASSMGGIR